MIPAINNAKKNERMRLAAFCRFAFSSPVLTFSAHPPYSKNASTARIIAGKSGGVRDVIRFSSTTTSASK